MLLVKESSNRKILNTKYKTFNIQSKGQAFMVSCLVI